MINVFFLVWGDICYIKLECSKQTLKTIGSYLNVNWSQTCHCIINVNLYLLTTTWCYIQVVVFLPDRFLDPQLVDFFALGPYTQTEMSYMCRCDLWKSLMLLNPSSNLNFRNNTQAFCPRCSIRSHLNWENVRLIMSQVFVFFIITLYSSRPVSNPDTLPLFMI